MTAAALSGTPEAYSGLSLLGFTKAFVAELVVNKVHAIIPRREDARKGFERVVDLLDDRLNKLDEQGAPWEAVLPLANVANQLRTSSNGGVEGWERALHLAQLTFTSVPNPDYDVVELAIDSPSAETEVEQLSEYDQILVREAAKRFIAELSNKT
jgi:hypothetical protein